MVPRPAGKGEAGGREPLLGFARKTGIEKSLSVRKRIEKVFYGKDRITVRFRWGLPVDGEMGETEVLSPAGRCAAVASVPAVPAQKKEPNPGMKLDSFDEFDSERKWS